MDPVPPPPPPPPPSPPHESLQIELARALAEIDVLRSTHATALQEARQEIERLSLAYTSTTTRLEATVKALADAEAEIARLRVQFDTSPSMRIHEETKHI